MERYITKEIKKVEHLIHQKIVSKRKIDDFLNITQLRILHFLKKCKGKKVYQKDLEEETSLKKSTITECLDQLEEMDIIERVPSKDDKRKKEIIFTDKLSCVDIELEKTIKETEDIMTKGIAKEDLETFFVVIDKIKENLKGEA